MLSVRNLLPDVYEPVLVRLEHNGRTNRFCVAYVTPNYRWYEAITELDLLENGYYVVEWQTIRECIHKDTQENSRLKSGAKEAKAKGQ